MRIEDRPSDGDAIEHLAVRAPPRIEFVATRPARGEPPSRIISPALANQ